MIARNGGSRSAGWDRGRGLSIPPEDHCNTWGNLQILNLWPYYSSPFLLPSPKCLDFPSCLRYEKKSNPRKKPLQKQIHYDRYYLFENSGSFSCSYFSLHFRFLNAHCLKGDSSGSYKRSVVSLCCFTWGHEVYSQYYGLTYFGRCNIQQTKPENRSAVQYLQVSCMLFILEYTLIRTAAKALEGKRLHYCKQLGTKDC